MCCLYDKSNKKVKYHFNPSPDAVVVALSVAIVFKMSINAY